jgi:hypothetical protein
MGIEALVGCTRISRLLLTKVEEKENLILTSYSSTGASTNLAPAYEHEYVRNNHDMDMSLCHRGVLVEHECV